MKGEASRIPFERRLSNVWARMPLFWRFQIAGWLMFVAVTFPLKLAVSSNAAVIIGSFGVRDGFSFVLTLGMRVIYDRIYHSYGRTAWVVAIVAVVSITAGLLQLGVFYVFGDIFPFEERTIFNESVGLGIFYYRTAFFAGWSLLYFGIRQALDGVDRDLRMAVIESEKRNAQLLMLRAQMNPHFLFNALNTVLAVIDKSRDELKALVRALAEYLRYSLETRGEERVMIGQEFDAIVNYLAVEKARFREKLDVECRIVPDARSALVPGIIIQPLVENAIKYGRKTSPRPLRVRLDVSTLDSNSVVIEVSNTGAWVERDPSNTLSGVGLENLKERLKLLYSDSHRFCITSENGWVIVRIQIPTTQ
jgi:two-component system LytT family sensor kinase